MPNLLLSFKLIVSYLIMLSARGRPSEQITLFERQGLAERQNKRM